MNSGRENPYRYIEGCLSNVTSNTVFVEVELGAVVHVTVPAGVRVVVIDRDDPDAERTVWTDAGAYRLIEDKEDVA